jgi:hypothetical protein
VRLKFLYFDGKVRLKFLYFGPGIWYGMAVGLAVVACLLVLRFHQREGLGLLPVDVKSQSMG